MSLPVDDLTRPITRDEAKAVIYSLLSAAGLPVTSWQEGAVMRTIVAIVAAFVAMFSSVMAVVVRGTFLDFAEGIWLTLLARYVYNVERLSATFAAGFVTLTNTGGGVYNLNPGELVLLNPTTKKTYTNTAVIALGALATLANVPIQAVEAGSASNASTGQITQFVTPLALVTVTNPNPITGRDGETDPLLRIRCRDSMGALSPNGPAAAFDYFAKNCPRTDGSIIEVTRTKTPVSSTTGLVSVTVASTTGTVTGPDVAIIQAYLAVKATPTGQTVVVSSATTAGVVIAGTLWVDATSTKSDADIKTAADAAIDAYFQTVPIGGLQKVSGTGKVFVDAIESQIFRALEELIDLDLSSPAVDVSLTSGQVPVRSGVSTWTVNRIVQT